MDKKNNSGGNGFNVFIFGIFIGVLATLLLTTKKGRKILKTLINEGTERISKWEDIVDSLKTEVVEEDMAEDSVVGEDVAPLPPKKIGPDTFAEADVEDQSLISEMPEENEIKSKSDLEPKPKIKIEVVDEAAPKKKSRFFKGTHKKSS